MHSPISVRARAAALVGLLAVAGFVAIPNAVTAAPSDDSPALDACPLSGPSTFEDSWGWPRSGGRSHEGVDMIADRGTPVTAVRDGFAQFKSNSLGGRAIWLTAPNGDKFYYAHLDSWEGASRDVRAGELIGYVGSTGNAHGTHLHFETLPGGNVENPFAHTLAACVPTPADLAAAANRLNDPAVWDRFIPAD